MRNLNSGLVAGLVALLATPTLAEVETTWHRNADPSGYRTFDWIIAPEGREGAAKGLGPRFDGIVRQAIESRLQAMGYDKAPGGAAPDFRVQYDASTADAYIREIRPEILPFNPNDWVLGEFATIRDSYRRGTLILTMRDGASDEPVWCGWTTEALKPRKLERQTRKLIQRVLRHYPPQGGEKDEER